MAMDNPAYTRNKGFTASKGTLSAAELQAMYDASPNTVTRSGGGSNTVAETPMSIEGAVGKSVGLFAVLVVGAVVGWVLTSSNHELGTKMMFGAMIIGFVLAMVNIFKKEPSPALIMAYAVVQGFFLGVISFVYNSQWDGIVLQAVLATLTIVGVTLALFASGKVRASAKATKVFMISMVGYLVFSLINMMLVSFGAIDNPWGVRGFEIFGIPLGALIGVFAILLGAYSLVLDFDFIQKGVVNQIPAKYEWTGAFGIMVTVIWLYLEMLRLLAITRN
ncbi:MAG: Bax inhibitor-1/YccA family protein [Actinomycetales bacterium]|nr:Bax inhibitor-1/YccA family protein [Actinomycetales bacterium]